MIQAIHQPVIFLNYMDIIVCLKVSILMPVITIHHSASHVTVLLAEHLDIS